MRLGQSKITFDDDDDDDDYYYYYYYCEKRLEKSLQKP